MLLIVDPQVDFITGTLAVPGARGAMDRLARYVAEEGERYAAVVVTVDSHPADHCSFADAGGPWPRHCVAGTAGAGIWPPLETALAKLRREPVVMAKGVKASVEEYSVLSSPGATARLRRMIADLSVTAIDICGIAGDVCVAATLADLIAGIQGVAFRVLRRFSPSTDGGAALQSLIDKTDTSCDR